ncbi:hypothetical protein EK599_08385 [Vibrio sp. T187]|uniref:outer membrane beta-barrel protein n=1 Tax=Vibrio TaxID=662 RepID=UPI0010C97D65|nr:MULTISPECIES: outer membrane beta-barrel protein [Vibrio]MBW3695711.1 hypothetical protein [Vibrio sp. T187]
MSKSKYVYLMGLFLSGLSGSTLAQTGPGVINTNVGATIISDGSESETAYFGQIGYSHYLNDLLAIDISYRHTETLNSSVSANSTSFSSKYDSYSLGLKVERGMGGFNIYGTGGGSYISSETTRWNTTTNAAETTSEDSVKPYATAGIKFAPLGSPLLLDASLTYQMLPNKESATSVSAGVYLMF